MNYLPIKFSSDIENIISGITIMQFLHEDDNSDDDEKRERVFTCATATDIIMVKNMLPKDVNSNIVNNYMQTIMLQTIPLPKEVDGLSATSSSSSSSSLFMKICEISLCNDDKWFESSKHALNQEKIIYRH